MKNKRIINFTYDIEFSPVDFFDFNQSNDIVNYNAYMNMKFKILYLTNMLNQNKDTRQAICFGDGIDVPSCLTSIQLLYKDKELYMLANFRSQHEELGKENDSVMLKYLATIAVNNLKHDLENIYIKCSIADFHNY